MKTAVRPRLVAFDLDGTLVGSALEIRPRVLAAVEAMERRGVLGCIVTGRMYRAARPFVERLGFTAPVVCYQGARIVDPATGAPIFDLPLPNAEALELEAYAREHHLHVQLYDDDNYYCERNGRYARIYAEVSGVEPVVVPSLRAYFAQRDATKCCIIAEPEVIAEHVERVAALMGRRAYVTRSLPWFLEVMNPGVDKGRALEIVANRLGVPLGEVVAVGDSWNDAPLLERAGFGIAMGSAPQELRAVADAIVADVEADGAAEAIERYVLQ